MGITATTLVVRLTTLGFNPVREIPEERVDLIEINHFHDDQGRPVFDQIIFYDWSPTDGRYQVRDWRLLKSPNQIPLHDSHHREFVATWNDFKAQDTLRTTKAKLMRETWTQYDPELVEREFLPENKRRKLRDVSSTKKFPSKTETAAGSPPVPSSTDGTNRGASLRPLQTPNVPRGN